MSNQWLRLWHDMPNDPKFRTVARISNQRIGDVLAVYLHLLTSASQNVTRGHVDVTAEDLASAIDVTDEAVEAILTAMQGRVLDGDRLTGWEKRQPKREDSGDDTSGAKSASQRKRDQREREKAAAAGVTGKPANKPCHAASRNVTTDKDKDKDKEHTQTGGRDMLPGEPDGSVCVLVCKAMRDAGIGDTNASDARLAVLVGEGATPGMFAAVAPAAVKLGKGFAYTLGIVKNQMAAAASMADAPLVAPAARVGKADVSRVTVPASAVADAELRRLALDAAIPRSGPPPELVERLAKRRGAVAVGAGA